jgi:hypothetical protein
VVTVFTHVLDRTIQLYAKLELFGCIRKSPEKKPRAPESAARMGTAERPLPLGKLDEFLGESVGTLKLASQILAVPQSAPHRKPLLLRSVELVT